MIEEWKDIKQTNGDYQISNFGNVRRATLAIGKGSKKTYIGKLIKLEKTTNGYLRLRLKGRKLRIRVHQLVAEAFIPNPQNKLFVNHINGIKNDNRVTNLEWVTTKENNLHYNKIVVRDFVNALDSTKSYTRDELQFLWGIPPIGV